mgnify:CR=1 FL=1
MAAQVLCLRFVDSCHWILRGSTDSSVAESKMLFLGDDHGGEAVVGRRDAN